MPNNKYWFQKKSESGDLIVFVLFREKSCNLVNVKNFMSFGPHFTYEICGFHSGFAEQLNHLGYYSLLASKWLPISCQVQFLDSLTLLDEVMKT